MDAERSVKSTFVLYTRLIERLRFSLRKDARQDPCRPPAKDLSPHHHPSGLQVLDRLTAVLHKRATPEIQQPAKSMGRALSQDIRICSGNTSRGLQRATDLPSSVTRYPPSAWQRTRGRLRRSLALYHRGAKAFVANNPYQPPRLLFTPLQSAPDSPQNGESALAGSMNIEPPALRYTQVTAVFFLDLFARIPVGMRLGGSKSSARVQRPIELAVLPTHNSKQVILHRERQLLFP
ncbi:hypothetical protein BJ138DRAFT_76920 [Hygrophoropsis aurantiaca]|uniref:Uncharacterized protein n=1 Tax=Hygrophoropsis aurantiaca TaxID=72124 RepID=A0ACB7ZTY8_9AGAM|nr:hypothetical protein BJ138DRAFT_76920 [Hygrophoropsis aurantiaca]